MWCLNQQPKPKPFGLWAHQSKCSTAHCIWFHPEQVFLDCFSSLSEKCWDKVRFHRLTFLKPQRSRFHLAPEYISRMDHLNYLLDKKISACGCKTCSETDGCVDDKKRRTETWISALIRWMRLYFIFSFDEGLTAFYSDQSEFWSNQIWICDSLII